MDNESKYKVGLRGLTLYVCQCMLAKNGLLVVIFGCYSNIRYIIMRTPCLLMNNVN